MLNLLSSLFSFCPIYLMHPPHSNNHAPEIFLLRTLLFFQLSLNQPMLLISTSAFLFEPQYPVIQSFILLFQSSAAGR